MTGRSSPRSHPCRPDLEGRQPHKFPKSHLHPGGWDKILPAIIAGASVDRFMHHAHLVVTEGESYRFAQARDGKGVTPLT